ncbi:peptidase M23 [Microbacterium sp. RD1]|uniref:peptidase M23 n=1 Tax=Microbacterium sp. RD1 TaxID=3457313 RepID=UPI003FA54821
MTAAQRRRAAARARRLRIALASAISVLGVGAVIWVAVMVNGAVQSFAAADAWDAPSEGAIVAQPPDDPFLRFTAEQLAHAQTIMAAGRDLGLPLRDQAVAVMTAMGESSLRNIDYGDWETSGVTNPDGSPTTSIGLFQQQDGWGSREQRLDPYTAATLFYRAMVARVPDPGRQQTEPTEIAHRTQINRDPNHYARYWPAAVTVVERLSGGSLGPLP